MRFISTRSNQSNFLSFKINLNGDFVCAQLKNKIFLFFIKKTMREKEREINYLHIKIDSKNISNCVINFLYIILANLRVIISKC